LRGKEERKKENPSLTIIISLTFKYPRLPILSSIPRQPSPFTPLPHQTPLISTHTKCLSFFNIIIIFIVTHHHPTAITINIYPTSITKPTPTSRLPNLHHTIFHASYHLPHHHLDHHQPPRHTIPSSRFSSLAITLPPFLCLLYFILFICLVNY